MIYKYRNDIFKTFYMIFVFMSNKIILHMVQITLVGYLISGWYLLFYTSDILILENNGQIIIITFLWQGSSDG